MTTRPGSWALLALATIALAVPAAASADGAQTLNQDFAWAGPNPCNGEAVAVTGQVNAVVSETIDASGGLHSVTIDANAHGTGEAPLAGVQYTLSDQQRVSLNFSSPTYEVSTDVHFLLHRQAESVAADDFYLSFTFHITSNANGQVTAEFVNGAYPDAQCK